MDARFRRYGYFYFLKERKTERQKERKTDKKKKRQKDKKKERQKDRQKRKTDKKERKKKKMPGRTNCGSDKWQVGQMTHFMYRLDKWQVGQMTGRTNDAFFV